MKQQAIFILGMHRSGTSALARVINLLGAELGSKLMAAAEDNERGFWEHEGAVSIHEELLNELGQRWCDGIPLPQGWQETEAATRARLGLGGLIDLDFRSAALWAIKDPRLSLLIPLWLPLLAERGMQPLAIVAWRNPEEVAASLQKRDAMDREAALLCWLAYTLESLLHALPHPFALLRYDELLTDWRGAADRLAAELQIAWPRRPDEAADAIEAFLTPELRHHRGAAHPAKAATPSMIEQLVEETAALLATAAVTSDAFPVQVRDLHRRWQALCAGFAPLLRDARREEAEWRKKALEQEHRAGDLEGQIQKLYEEYKDSLVHQRMLSEGLSHAEAQVARLQEEIEAIRSSTSWKVTEPLRKVKKIVE